MKNVRKIVGLVMDEYVKTNPPPKDLGFTDEEVRAGTEELLDVLEAVVSVAKSLDRIATALEQIAGNSELSIRHKIHGII